VKPKWKRQNLHPFVISTAETEQEAIEKLKNYHQRLYGHKGEKLQIVKVEEKPAFVVWYRTKKD
jgi:hypothetical protein